MMRKCFRFDCDRCGSTVYVPGGNAPDALARVRRRGWKVGKHHRCFACVKARRPDLFKELFEPAAAAPARSGA